MTIQNAMAISPQKELRTGLVAMKSEFARALPTGIDPDKFLRVAETAIFSNPDLTNSDRKSLYGACAKAAADGLLPDGREGALVVFAGKAQWMPMVQGLIKLARNSGEISNIVAEVVYSNDKFQYRIGLDEMPMHEPDWFADDRGAPIGAWAVVILKNGEKIVSVMPKARILKIGGKSKNGSQYNPQTGAYFEEWWKKTAVKNVLKYAPRATERERLDKLMEREMVDEFIAETRQEVNQTEQQFEPPLEVTPEPVQPRKTASKKLDALKAAHKPTTPVQDVIQESEHFEGEIQEDDF